MLDLKLLQKQPEVVAKALADRHSSVSVEEFKELDARRRAALTEVETLKAQLKKESGDVARLKRAGQDASELVARLGLLSDRIKELDQKADDIKEQLYQWMLRVPNIPDASVPVGLDENDNPELHRWGTPRDFGFAPRQHFEVGAAAVGLDFERGAKLAGSRFCVSHGVFARLERALMNFYLDTQTAEFGATEIMPPYMVNRATMQGTGQLPKFEEDLFKMPEWDFYLIPTAEVPVTNLHAGEILEEDQLPLRYTAGTPCFRSEAGSAGKDVRGLIRQHQFIKVEMVRFAHPDRSWEELEDMRRCAEILLEKLELPYRTITLCTGDMGFGSAKTYDVEVWLPSQNCYREISSCSNCVDFQARRMNTRYRPADGGKPKFVHTLNGSGLAIGRTLIAVLENGQNADGSIDLPDALVPYMGGVKRIEPLAK